MFSTNFQKILAAVLLKKFFFEKSKMTAKMAAML